MDKLMASGKIKGVLAIHQAKTALPPEGIIYIFIHQFDKYMFSLKSVF